MTHRREPQEVIVAGPDLGQKEQTETAGPVSYCSQPREMERYERRVGVSEMERWIKRPVKHGCMLGRGEETRA